MKVFDHTSGQYFTNDARIYYEATGNPNGPVLLLLHGGFGTLADFNPVIPMLDEKYSVIGVDSRGHGKSILGSETLTYGRIQKDVEKLLQHLGINKLTIMGFSDGGIVAYRVAALSKLEIEKLVTIGSSWHKDDLLETEDVLSKVTAESWTKKFPETVELYNKVNPEAHFERLAAAVKTMWLDKGESGRPGDYVKNIKAPLLMMRGDKDHLTTSQSFVNLKKLLPDAAYFNIPYATHVAYLDQPELFKIALQQFLNK
jgi:pimeloyl-ACP methyl ester carboxylesterase